MVPEQSCRSGRERTIVDEPEIPWAELSLLKRYQLLALIFLMSSCAHFEARPIDPGQAAESFDARSFDDPGLAEYLSANGTSRPGVDESWDLSRLTLAAFYFSPEMDLARARVQTAEAGRVSAGLRPDPAVSLTPGYDTTTPPPWIWTVDLAIPVTTASKRGYRMAEAERLTEAARWDLAGTAWEVRSRLRQALVEYSAAAEILRIQQDLQRLQTDVVRRTGERVASGEEPASRLAEVHLDQQNSNLALAEAEQEVARTQAALAAAIGVPRKVLVGLPIRFEELGSVPGDLSPSQVRRAAAVNRTDVRSALSVYAASQSALQLEIAKQYPDLELGPGYELDQTDDKWTLGLAFTLPLLNRNRGGIAEARARREEAAAVFNTVQAAALTEVDRTLSTYESARREGIAADSLAASLERIRRAALEREEAGDLSPLETALARIRYDEGLLAMISAVMKVQQALGDLEAAIQQPLTGSGITWPDAATTIIPPKKDPGRS
jgi:cobalt-zinc-cadmium efflux system outer membrane protein